MSTPSTSGGLRHKLSFTNISAIYILIAVLVVFSLWIPNRFLQLGDVYKRQEQADRGADEDHERELDDDRQFQVC